MGKTIIIDVKGMNNINNSCDVSSDLCNHMIVANAKNGCGKENYNLVHPGQEISSLTLRWHSLQVCQIASYSHKVIGFLGDLILARFGDILLRLFAVSRKFKMMEGVHWTS